MPTGVQHMTSSKTLSETVGLRATPSEKGTNTMGRVLETKPSGKVKKTAHERRPRTCFTRSFLQWSALTRSTQPN